MSQMINAQEPDKGRVRKLEDDMLRGPLVPVFYHATDSDSGMRLMDSAYSLNLATAFSPYLAARVQPTKNEQDPAKTDNAITISGPAADFDFCKEILLLLTRYCNTPSHQLLPKFRVSVTPIYELLKLLWTAETFEAPKEVVQAINDSIVSHSNTVRFQDASAIISGFPEGDLTHHFLAEALARQCAPLWSAYAQDEEVMDVLCDPRFKDLFMPYLVRELKRVADERRRNDEQLKQEWLRQELAREEWFRREEESKEAGRRAHAKRCAEATNLSVVAADPWEDVDEEVLESSEARIRRIFSYW